MPGLLTMLCHDVLPDMTQELNRGPPLILQAVVQGLIQHPMQVDSAAADGAETPALPEADIKEAWLDACRVTYKVQPTSSAHVCSLCC